MGECVILSKAEWLEYQRDRRAIFRYNLRPCPLCAERFSDEDFEYPHDGRTTLLCRDCQEGEDTARALEAEAERGKAASKGMEA